MENVWEKMRKSKGVTRVEIAKEMGIDEEKLEEIENNSREMPKERIDEYVATIHKLSKKDRAIKVAEARAWYEQADLNRLIKEFGFDSQREFANHFGCEQSSVSIWANKRRKIGTPALLRLYYFFNDGFNKKVKTVEEPKGEVDLKEWWGNFDLSNVIYKSGFKNQKEFAKSYGFSQSCISVWANKQAMPSNKSLKRLYELFGNTTEEVEEKTNNLASNIEKENTDEVETANYCQVLDQEETTPTYTISTTIDTLMEEDTTEEDLCRLKEENEHLRKQIKRYEALIDMIILKGER